LMQRMSVDFPVPDGPMTAVMPRFANVMLMSRNTGTPRRYSLRSPRISSAGAGAAALESAGRVVSDIHGYFFDFASSAFLRAASSRAASFSYAARLNGVPVPSAILRTTSQSFW